MCIPCLGIATFLHPQVMLAASYWSLLAPAIELADASGFYGSLTFLPISLGFAAGAVFVYLADLLLPLMVWDPHTCKRTFPPSNKLLTVVFVVHNVHEIVLCGGVSGHSSYIH